MNKELEQLEWIRQYEYINPKLKEKLDIIEIALKRLEIYEKRAELVATGNVIDINTIKLKALEIIIKKKVNIDWLLETENVEEYNESLYVDLTKEEYNLLKEILK